VAFHLAVSTAAATLLWCGFEKQMLKGRSVSEWETASDLHECQVL